MAIFDDIDAKKALQAQGSNDRLARLAREWFAEAREKSAREEADFAAWNRERKKWTDFGPGLDFDLGSDGGGDGSGD